jgi:hypothetical protein
MAIRYHAWWPSASDPYYVYNTTENRTRVNYYPPHTDGGYYTPYVWIDGIVRGGYTSSAWWNLVQTRYAVASPLEITLDGNFNDVARTGNIHIKVKATAAVTNPSLKVKIALTESNINWRAPNGSTIHNQTLRDMIPTPTGTPLTIVEGDSVMLSQAFTCPAAINWENSEIIVFVQSEPGREILQSAKITLSELQEQTGIEDYTNIPQTFSLEQNYPNPFNAVTKIMYSLSNESNVRLTVYDLTGRQVVCLQNGKQGTGHYQINWNGADSNGKTVSSGIYFYRLEAGDKSVTKRMALLK